MRKIFCACKGSYKQSSRLLELVTSHVKFGILYQIPVCGEFKHQRSKALWMWMTLFYREISIIISFLRSWNFDTKIEWYLLEFIQFFSWKKTCKTSSLPDFLSSFGLPQRLSQYGSVLSAPFCFIILILACSWAKQRILYLS